MRTSPRGRTRPGAHLPVVLVGAVCLAAGLCGCRSQPETMPSQVPTDSTAWICPGVPAHSVEVVTGKNPEVKTSGDPYGRMWACHAQNTRINHGAGPIAEVNWGVIYEGNSYKYTGEESARVRFPENIWTLPGVEGSGSWATNGADRDSTAQWVCGDRYVEAYVAVNKDQKRDSTVDARNLLTSVLPWACGDQPVPGATTTPTTTPTSQ